MIRTVCCLLLSCLCFLSIGPIFMAMHHAWYDWLLPSGPAERRALLYGLTFIAGLLSGIFFVASKRET